MFLRLKDTIFQIDDEDLPILLPYRWRVYQGRNPTDKYIITNKSLKDLTRPNKLHRLILDVRNPDQKVDHIDRNPLNNCKNNLRIVKNHENIQNQKRSSANTSGYKGVTYFKRDNKWRARVYSTVTGIRIDEYYNTKEEAWEAYKRNAKLMYGEFFCEGWAPPTLHVPDNIEIPDLNDLCNSTNKWEFRNILKKGNKYLFRKIVNGAHYNKMFNTIAEAVHYRDNSLFLTEKENA